MALAGGSRCELVRGHVVGEVAGYVAGIVVAGGAMLVHEDDVISRAPPA